LGGRASGCTVNGNTYENCYLGFKRNGAPPEEAWPWTEPMTRKEYGKEPPQYVKTEASKIFEDWDILTPVYAGRTVDQLRAALKKGVRVQVTGPGAGVAPGVWAVATVLMLSTPIRTAVTAAGKPRLARFMYALCEIAP